MNNTQRFVTSALDGTKTKENLTRAFEKEAINYAKGRIFSSAAEAEGKISAHRALRDQADNDRHLAELWLSYLDEIDDTLENLYELSDEKDALDSDFYPFIADVADEEGFYEIAEKLRLASAAKATHAQALKNEGERLENPDSIHAQSADTPWICTVCGYVIKGNTPPERCPLCSYPSEYFVRG